MWYTLIVFNKNDKMELIQSIDYIYHKDYSNLPDNWKNALSKIINCFIGDDYTSSIVRENLYKLSHYKSLMTSAGADSLDELLDIYEI